MACDDVTPRTVYLPTCGLTTMTIVKSSTPPNGSLIMPGDALSWQLLIESTADGLPGIIVEDIFDNCDYITNLQADLPWLLTVDPDNPCRFILDHLTAVNPGVYVCNLTAIAGTSLGGDPPVYEGFGTLNNTANILNPDPTLGNSVELIFAPLLAGAVPDQYLNAIVNYQYQILSGTAPFTVSLALGALPTGLAISAGGLLSGITSEVGDFSYTLELLDANGNTFLLSDDCTVVAPATLVSGEDEGVEALGFNVTSITMS